MTLRETILLTREHVKALLTVEESIAAVERAFRLIPARLRRSRS